MRIYAIGDIHGQYEMLLEAHDRIEADRVRTGDRDALVVHLGDLTDRGPDSNAVIAHLIEGIEAGEPWAVIRGNHDKMFTDFLRSASYADQRLRIGLDWLNTHLGGATTLASYGVDQGLFRRKSRIQADAAEAVPEKHIAFLESLPLYYETPDLVFVHAGIRPGLPLRDQIEEDLIWIRDEFLYDTRDHGKLIVHGHTPVERPMHCGNRVNLDTGAGFGRALTAAVFEDRRVWILGAGGRTPLEPINGDGKLAL
ncbi:MAG: serine/threonine protein phosphatase [Rhodobacteraceae bacterium]|nr:serine/threonine protein phosphatase [Paracoccaceae bacterium]